MKRSLSALFLFSLLAAPLGAQVEQTLDTRVFLTVRDSIVRMTNWGRPNGSGIIVSQDGWVITNAHVVSLPPRVEVVLEFKDEDGKKRELPFAVDYSAGVKLHKKYDLCLVKINPKQHGVKLKPIEMRTTELLVGERCFAVGYPQLTGKQQTPGTVTSPSAAREGDDLSYVYSTNTVQGGNSGGALVDAEGKAIGVVTFFMRDPRGSAPLCGAVPAAAFMPEARENEFVPWGNFKGNAKNAGQYLKQAQEFEAVARQIIETYGSDDKNAVYFQMMAAMMYDRAISANPKNVTLYERVAWLNLQNKRAKQADSYLTQGIMIAPDKASRLIGLLGWSLVETNKLEDADFACQEALIQDPNSAINWAAAGRMFLAKKKFDLADVYAKVAMKLISKDEVQNTLYSHALSRLASDADSEYRSTGDPEQDDFYVNGEMKRLTKEFHAKRLKPTSTDKRFVTEKFNGYMTKRFPPPMPTAIGHAYTMTEGGTLKVEADDGLLKSANPGLDSKAKLTAAVSKQPVHGVLRVNSDGSFQYTPDPKETGRVTFTFKVKEGKVLSLAQKVTILINKKMPAPTAVADTYSVVAGRTLSVKSVNSVLE